MNEQSSELSCKLSNTVMQKKEIQKSRAHLNQSIVTVFVVLF